MKTVVRLMVCAVAVALFAEGVQAQDEKVAPDKLPPKVAEVVKARFPGATITAATKATENNEVIYDIEMTKDGKKHEIDLKEDGTIINIEHEIAATALPAAITSAVKAKYPGCTIKEVMQINVLKDNKETLDEYEVIIETADKKELELAISADGKKIEEAK
jgi:uncharacterized membrane protein YkoI